VDRLGCARLLAIFTIRETFRSLAPKEEEDHTLYCRFCGYYCPVFMTPSEPPTSPPIIQCCNCRGIVDAPLPEPTSSIKTAREMILESEVLNPIVSGEERETDIKPVPN